MLEARIDLSQLSAALADVAAALGPASIAPAVNQDAAEFYASQPVPVDTGRLRRAVAQTVSPERRVVVTPGGVRVEIRLPYAGVQLRRVPRYRPVRLVALISDAVRQRLAKRGQR